MRPPRGKPEFIAVGLVLGAYGARGDVRVRALSDFPDRLRELEKVRVTRDAGRVTSRAEWRAVESAERHGEDYVLRLEGVSERNAAAALHGALLEIPAAEVRPLPPGSFYRFEVVGLEVMDESGRRLGRVSDVLETGANDVYVVTREGVAPEGGKGRRDEILVPALREVVLELNPTAGRMVVRLPRVWDERDEV